MQKKNYQAHQLSSQDLRDLQDKQISGDEIDTIDANVDGTRQIAAHEAHLIHAEIEAKSFDAQTGDKLSKPVVQKFYPDDFDRMEAAGAFKGKTVTLIHDPSQQKKEHVKKIKENNNLDVNGQKQEPGAGQQQKKPAEKPLTPAQQKKADDAKIKLDAENLLKAQATYKELYNDEAPKDATIDDLTEAIESKLQEIEDAKDKKDPEA